MKSAFLHSFDSVSKASSLEVPDPDVGDVLGSNCHLHVKPKENQYVRERSARESKKLLRAKAVATLLNVGLLVFMRLWQPHPDSVFPLFVITSLFGFADGIWNVNANGLCGSVFPDHFEEAFTGLRVAQGLGGAFSMAYAPFFCMAVKIYVMIAVVVVVLIGYISAEILIRRDARKKHGIVFEKEIV